ncbi:hypothetical protein NHX12_033362 [Muraenolepis orangiensis]|uniref:Uncharacterized protein n=1 Tax=Muraenolepis orangiensis TaxID=630683 RepID=A0A9Q0E3J1_9TELE|nr:hypothetical protein NHX12_033362 [Muraenolepis orangiensis]
MRNPGGNRPRDGEHELKLWSDRGAETNGPPVRRPVHPSEVRGSTPQRSEGPPLRGQRVHPSEVRGSTPQRSEGPGPRETITENPEKKYREDDEGRERDGTRHKTFWTLPEPPSGELDSS